MGGGLESRYVGRVCGADGTTAPSAPSIKLPYCIKLEFHVNFNVVF